jgi:glycogen operon protein
VTDKNFLVLFNGGDDTVDFVLPPEEYSGYWEIVVDTVGEQADSHAREAGSTLPVNGKAVLVLRAHTPSAAETADHSVAASLAPAPSVVSVQSVASVPVPDPEPVAAAESPTKKKAPKP